MQTENYNENPIDINACGISQSDISDFIGNKDHHEKLDNLTLAILKQPEKAVDCPLAHHFANCLYARDIFIAKGVILVGKVHLKDCVNIVSKGELSVIMNGEFVRIKAPYTFVSPAGTRRSMYAHEDSIWTTIHTNPTNTQNIEELENYLVVKTYKEFIEYNQESLT